MSPCSGGAACSSPAVKRYLSRGMEFRQGHQIGQRAPSFPPSPNSAVFFSPLSSKSSSLSPLYKLSDPMAEAAAPCLFMAFPLPFTHHPGGWIYRCAAPFRGFPGGSHGMESACSAGNPGSILGLERSLGEGKGYPPQYSCLENSMDRGACWAAVHGIKKSQMQLSTHTGGQNPSPIETRWMRCFLSRQKRWILARSTYIFKFSKA